MDDHLSAKPAASYQDENERLALEECVKRQRIDQRVSVLVFPAGRCELAIQFARLGASVFVGDQPGRQLEVENRALADGMQDNIRFFPCALNDLPADLPGDPHDIIFLRRGLSQLPYHQGCAAIRQLLRHLRIGGKLYLSLLGLHSELSDGYSGRDRPIGERFAHLSPALAARYEIDEPVCLYSERDLFMLLLEAGVSVLRTLTTTYGNVMGVGVRV
ncbi:MAG: class I SAM-dependent methyltransferase [Desulfobulbus sp.]|nr:class I SAM-dependent methyltransferase [Desulfobulbus sp.]